MKNSDLKLEDMHFHVIGSDEDSELEEAKLIGYTGDTCKNCKRVRVELWDNGNKICEKCFWDQDKNEYYFSYDI